MVKVAGWAFLRAGAVSADAALTGLNGTQEASEIGELAVPHCTTPSLFKNDGPAPGASRLPLGEPVELDENV